MPAIISRRKREAEQDTIQRALGSKDEKNVLCGVANPQSLSEESISMCPRKLESMCPQTREYVSANSRTCICTYVTAHLYVCAGVYINAA
jgi:hypothetical protein